MNNSETKQISEMTLRDYFAAKAMQSLLIDVSDTDSAYYEKECVRVAYRFADAMLAEREKGVQK